ncbi:MAG: chemotaxis protein CheW [Cyanothece sp. SIO1E1]|nr:chemotaxis protein CheW [Cyanothece sp. SIO1E1]
MPSSLESMLTTTSLDRLTLEPFSTAEPLPAETHQRLLRFPLGAQESALLPLAEIAEILRLDVGEILSVPEMPSCVLGICNWRGAMLWLVDLNELLGFSPLLQPEQTLTTLSIIVIQVDGQPLGLGVPQVNDVELHDWHELQPVVNNIFPPKLMPFILGYLPQDRGVVLDVAAIAQFPLWQVSR